MSNGPIDIYFLLGPTASGKSGAGLCLAKRAGAEILSVDSMQVYRGMDIGTAKATAAEQREVRHHLIDVAEPSESFSAAKFVELAEAAVGDMAEREKRVLAVGGTALYAKALAEGLFDGPGSNAPLRRELKDRAERVGSEVLHEELRQVDPEAAGKIHPNDLRRIVRGLEVFELTGRPISALQQQFGRANPAYRCKYVCLRREKEDLHGRINGRLKAMIEAGLVEEVQGLLASEREMSTQAQQALGYQEIISHLAGQMGLDEAVEAIKINTRRFAKRQQTWFRRFPGVAWVDTGTEESSEELGHRCGEALGLVQDQR